MEINYRFLGLLWIQTSQKDSKGFLLVQHLINETIFDFFEIQTSYLVLVHTIRRP
jgi:hypothetical protein